MPEEKKVTLEGGEQPNPSTEQPATASEQKPKPLNAPGDSADLTTLKAQLDEVNSKLERYKEQVKGSSEEALRLKEENEALQKKLTEIEANGATNQTETFQKIMEDQGIQAAVDYAVKEKIASLQSRVDAFEKKEEGKVFETFKETHKGLDNVENLKKFEAELSKLQHAYSDVNEAMEKAYILSGAAESVEPDPVTEPVEDGTEKKVVKSVLGGDEERKPAIPATTNATDIQKQINDLQYEAMTLQSTGRIRQAAEILARVEDLKTRLGEKV